ncbi:Carboxy-terminal domain (CTD) phosphatase [Serendipita sp. 411]|nr:Carboxy-terminal domain (CTD) phosphatase [Serendipita sp. 411]
MTGSKLSTILRPDLLNGIDSSHYTIVGRCFDDIELTVLFFLTQRTTLMSEQTDLNLPRGLPYPIKIIKLLVSRGDNIQRGTPLLHYSFKYRSTDDEGQSTEAKLYGTWESHVEGKVELWNVDLGEEVASDYGPVLVVTEPCKHGTQIMGMCADCGKDMTEIDYMSISATQRAQIKMDHSGEGPLLSQEQASQIERESAEHLLKARKLSLIVDLDQTILHATTDPTVGDWLKSKDAATEGKTPNSSEPSPEESVNWPALNDVVQFQLPAENHRFRYTANEWFYIKPRPGLIQFMQNLSNLYEMHVYTMGTRSYANAVCSALDPSGAWFGSRILTRSESGSDRFKNLKRLFPSDQSMVVVIDDRADVWDWSPNLVKVKPFEFFVGTGDINASFLPKQKSLIPDLPPVVPPEDPVIPKENDTPQDSDDIAARREIQAKEIAQLKEDRPLEKAQRSASLEAGDQVSSSNGHSKKASSSDHVSEVPKPVLRTDDHELDRVEEILISVHQEYYMAHDARLGSKLASIPDVSRIIPSRRKQTFANLGIVFSSVFPLDQRPESTDVWKSATAFGAVCYTDINPEVTHLVAAKPGTVKVDKALAQGNIFVVNPQWLYDSISNWKRQPESNYLLKNPSKQRANQERDKDSPRNTPGSQVSPGEETRVAQVSASEGVEENGTNPWTSQLEDQFDDPAESAEGIDTAEVAQKEDVLDGIALHIDWADIDKEVDDALASDDDGDEDEDEMEEDTDNQITTQENEKGGTRGDSDEPKLMEGINPITRGVKRRRSPGSIPSTPSKLRFSYTADDLMGDHSPKRQRLDEAIEEPRSARVAGAVEAISKETDMNAASPNDNDEDEDEDDFLAREMANGGGGDWASDSESG